MIVKPYQKESTSTPAHANTSPSKALKLPPLTLKAFSGLPDQWLSFQGLFEASIHKNDKLNDTEKFQYLITSLEGEPLNLIKNLPITEENYIVAWELLKNRYQNNRRMIIHYVNNLIDLSNITSGNSKAIRTFLSKFQENTQALEALKHEVRKNNIILSTMLLRKLDGELRKKFEDCREDSQKIPSVEEIMSFLEDECTHMEAANLSSLRISSAPHSNVKSNSDYSKVTNKPRTVLLSAPGLPQNPRCAFCNKSGHVIYRCTDFQAMTPSSKFEFIKKKHFCFNCLGTAHSSNDCKSKRSCFHCGKKHHSWLHLSNRSTPTSTLTPLPSQQVKRNVVDTNLSVSASDKEKHPVVVFSQSNVVKSSTVLLGTTLVYVSNKDGHSLVLRAVLDSGSMISCLTENAANLLSLNRWHNGHSDVDGLSSSHISTKGASKVNISSLKGTDIVKNHPVVILDRITSDLPQARISAAFKNKLKHLVLADPTFDLPSSVDMLLGADLFCKIVTEDHVTFGDNMPMAMNSVFGYLIVGPAPLERTPCKEGTVSLLTTHEVDLHRSLQRFWLLEEPPLKIKPSPEDDLCEQLFLAHHSRDSKGRYTVRLPFKEALAPLGNSSENAKRRFLSLEKRLNANPELKTDYVNCMNDYIESGHMEIVTQDRLDESQHFFLPHHAVVKNESSSTKLRVVFDASAPSSTGISLNQTLLSGPKLQNKICDILINFRLHPIVMSCDIKQMFRQIKMHPEDQNFQLLYWRKDSSLPLSIYRLTTVVFGFVSSPFLAIRTLKQLVLDEGQNYPLASKVMEKQVYVDDLIFGANSPDEARTTQKEIIDLLSKGGFDLRKWVCNQPELISDIPESYKEKPMYFQGPDNPFYSILGIKWESENDHFSYRLDIPEKPLTKRNILSAVAQIFDPCGYLAPTIFWTKALLQLLWTLGLKWDEPIPTDVAEKWNKFYDQLPQLRNIFIPRYVHLHDAVDVQLHGFSDGSEAGYSAVVYIRTVSADNNIRVSLLIAKSRVAPLKRISIPRLELCGAHLLAELLNYSSNLISQRCEINSIFAWTDSTVVLSWIHSPPFRLKVYVANRISQIQDLVPPHMWSHISTHYNPADCASRGLLPSCLVNHKLWWYGPPWLSNPTTEWPVSSFKIMKNEELPELRSEPLNVLIAVNELDIFSKFSSWSKLLRVLSYVFRFIKNTRLKKKESRSLQLEELNNASVQICKILQLSVFQEDIARLKSGKLVTSRLKHLSPFIDDSGLLRVGGRIQHSTLSFAAKYPIILPKSHHITNIIIDYYHLKYLHAGPQFLQGIISQRFWILSARSVIKSRIFKCVRCFRCRPTLASQKMGDLPPVRVTPSKVFFNCGTDFMGPFLVKPNNLRKTSPVKMYLCIFICLAVKAVHLEVVSSLTSEAFIAALTRFVSRRGLCSNIFSDCGTNYVGAAAELQHIQSFLQQDETKKALNKFGNENHIKFNFIPPAAPHQGGIWERTVRSVKYHLRRVIGEQLLNFEEFLTLSTKIEAILNSRPITALSSDPAEVDYLTPGHFLIGSPLLALPEPTWEEVRSNRLSRWQLVQAMSQHFWKRWQKDYLHTLQRRGKWTLPQVNIKEGDLVLIHEENSPPLSWRTGRVTATSPGPDGLVRVVHLHTNKGPLTRAVTKVSPFPIEE